MIDVAIAAPLETGQRDDGTEYTGVVYIFRGVSPTSIAAEYSQVCCVNSLARSTWGWRTGSFLVTCTNDY